MSIKKTIAVSAILAATSVQGGVEPLPRIVDSLNAEKAVSFVTHPDEKFSFFKENFVAGGYAYKYPDESKVIIPEESGKSGEVSLLFELDANEYSGGAVVLHGTSYDLSKYYATGALEFWIKGAKGGEKCNIVLADDEMENGVKTEVKVNIDKYGGIQPYWTHVSIPLSDFGRRGSYWDEKKQIEVKHSFDWNLVKEFLVTIGKGDNKSFKIWIDDINILADQYEAPANLNDPYWDEVKEVIPNHPAQPEKPVTVVKELFYGDFTEAMYVEPYGGQTANAMQPTDNPTANPEVMAFYLDNSDYSGITMRLGQSHDIAALRKSGAGLGFWGKAAPGVTKFLIGLNDDDSDKRSVGTSILLSDYGTLDGEWHYFMIPLKEFSDEGGWWDENSKSEKPGKMDWAAIDGITFTADKYGNRIAPGVPAAFYFDKVAIIESVPGYVDPDIFWDNFHSTAADKTLFDFEDGKEGWDGIAGEQSAISAFVARQEDRGLRSLYGQRFLKFEYSLNDWAYVGYPFSRYSAGPELTDWSEHRAITMDVHCDRDSEVLSVRVKDAGKEEWFANVTIVRGWNKVTIPFRKFRKDPYYQIPGALVDGKLDLTRVSELSFAPTTLGVMSRITIDNVTLTNNSND